MSHLRHPPALWQDLSVQLLCTVLFNSFRCLSAGSCARHWDCYFHDTLAYCPEPGVKILVQRCAASPPLLPSHHPPDCASCATVPGNIFTAVHLPPLGVFFFFSFSQCFSCQWMVFPAFSSPEACWRISYLWIHYCASPWGRKAMLGQPHCWICWCTGPTLSLGNCAGWNTKPLWSFMPSPSLGSWIHHSGYGD